MDKEKRLPLEPQFTDFLDALDDIKLIDEPSKNRS